MPNDDNDSAYILDCSDYNTSSRSFGSTIIDDGQRHDDDSKKHNESGNQDEGDTTSTNNDTPSNIKNDNHQHKVRHNNTNIESRSNSSDQDIIAQLKQELTDAKAANAKLRRQAEKQERAIKFLYNYNERMTNLQEDSARIHQRDIRNLRDKNAFLVEKNDRLELENRQLLECVDAVRKSHQAILESTSYKSSSSSGEKYREMEEAANRSGNTRSTASSTIYTTLKDPAPVANAVPNSAAHPAPGPRRRSSMLAGVRDIHRRLLEERLLDAPTAQSSTSRQKSINDCGDFHHARRRNSLPLPIMTESPRCRDVIDDPDICISDNEDDDNDDSIIGSTLVFQGSNLSDKERFGGGHSWRKARRASMY